MRYDDMDCAYGCKEGILTMIAIAVVLVIVGIGHLVAPRVSWWLSLGWRIQDASPSQVYLVVARAGGAILAVVGVVLFMIGVSQVTQQSAHATQVWKKFESKMTVKNIQSIQGSGTRSLPVGAVSSLVKDLHAIKTPVSYSTGNSSATQSFSAQSSWVIQCHDGYKASIIDINGSGKFGMAIGTNWLAPAYVFQSSGLTHWEQQWIK